MGVVDPMLAVSAVKDYAEALHLAVQLAFRKTLGALTLDALLADKVSVSDEAAAKVRAEMAKVGIEVGEIALKDVILPGVGGVLVAELDAEQHGVHFSAKVEIPDEICLADQVFASRRVAIAVKFNFGKRAVGDDD